MRIKKPYLAILSISIILQIITIITVWRIDFFFFITLAIWSVLIIYLIIKLVNIIRKKVKFNKSLFFFGLLNFVLFIASYPINHALFTKYWDKPEIAKFYDNDSFCTFEVSFKNNGKFIATGGCFFENKKAFGEYTFDGEEFIIETSYDPNNQLCSKYILNTIEEVQWAVPVKNNYNEKAYKKIRCITHR